MAWDFWRRPIDHHTTISQIIAINPSNGDILWQKEVPGSVNGLAMSPNKDIIYSVDPFGTLTAFESTGNIKWQLNIRLERRTIKDKPTIAEDGTIYLGDSGGYLYAISQSGSVLWQKELGRCALEQPVIDVNHKKIYVVSECDDNYSAKFISRGLRGAHYPREYALYSLDSNTQTIIWKKTYHDIGYLSLSREGHIYFIYSNKYENQEWNMGVLALDVNGQMLWSYDLKPRGVWQGNIEVLPNGNLYIARLGHILVLSPNGKLLGQYRIDTWSSSTDKGNFLMNINGNIVYAFSTEDEYQAVRVGAYQINDAPISQ